MIWKQESVLLRNYSISYRRLKSSYTCNRAANVQDEQEKLHLRDQEKQMRSRSTALGI